MAEVHVVPGHVALLVGMPSLENQVAAGQRPAEEVEEGAAGQPLQDVDPLRPVLVEEVEPADRLALAQQGEAAALALPPQLEERIAPHERADRRGQQRRRVIAEEAGGRVAPVRPLAQPPEAERLVTVGQREGLDLPGAGDVRLGGGRRLVLLLEAIQELLGESVAGRGGARIFRITHGGLLCGWARASDGSPGPFSFVAGHAGRGLAAIKTYAFLTLCILAGGQRKSRGNFAPRING